MLLGMSTVCREQTDADIATEKWAIVEARRLTLKVIGSASVRAFLFGSRAVGAERRFSDIDIALEAADGPVDPVLVSDLREALEESHIPYEADVVDLYWADPELVAEVRKHGVEWTV